jgi:protein-tyrosine phosphatase
MGRIDVHAHLLSGVDDGCQTLDESLACARRLVEAGYSHVFCTPHVWSNLPHNNPRQIAARTAQLQSALDSAGIPLILLSGGEINLVSQLQDCPPLQIVTYAMAGRWVLVDLWADRIPDFFEPTVRRLQSHGLSVVLAHPERMRAVQDDPALAEWFAELDVRLQGNFQCFSDHPDAHTRRTAERFLEEGRYFLLGTDLHGWESLPARLAGFQRVQSITDPQTFDRLTVDHPRLLFPPGP